MASPCACQGRHGGAHSQNLSSVDCTQSESKFSRHCTPRLPSNRTASSKAQLANWALPPGWHAPRMLWRPPPSGLSTERVAGWRNPCWRQPAESQGGQSLGWCGPVGPTAECRPLTEAGTLGRLPTGNFGRHTFLTPTPQFNPLCGRAPAHRDAGFQHEQRSQVSCEARESSAEVAVQQWQQ